MTSTVGEIDNDRTGNGVIVCLMFHFFQLFFDSMLASFLAQRTAAG